MELLKIDKFKDTIIILSKIALLIVVGLTIFILNYSQVYSPDDYTYSVVMGNFDNRIDSIDELIVNAKYFYNNWTGRLIPHTLIGIFRNINPHIFEVVNTIVFLIFITYTSKVFTKKSSFLGILTVFAYFTYSKMFGEKFSWISGALNYLWPTTFMMIFIYVLYNYLYKTIKLNTLQKILFSLYAFIVGFAHETTTFVAGSFFVCILLLNIKDIWKESKKEKLYLAITFLMFCFGAYLTIFAPGNFTRMNVERPGISILTLKNYADAKFHLLIIFISMIVMYKLKEKDMLKKELLLCIVPVIIATIPMLIIGEFPERAFISFEALLALILATNISIIAKKYDKYAKVIAVISVLSVIFTYARFGPSTLAQIRYIIPYKYQVMAILEENRGKQDERILIPSFEYSPWMHAEDYININNFFIDWREDLPINIFTAAYYKVGSVKTIAKDEFLVELTVDTPEDEYNTYVIWDVDTGARIREMSYFNKIEYPLKKDKFGIYKIDGSKNNLKDKVLEIKMYTIEDGQISTNKIKPEDLIYNKGE